MVAAGLDEAGLWRVLANGHLPEAMRRREELRVWIRARLNIPEPTADRVTRAKWSRRKGKRKKKEGAPKARILKADGQTRRKGSHRSQS